MVERTEQIGLARITGEARATTDTIYGLSHLEGEEVVVLADGNVIRGLVVQPGGRLDLPAAYGRVHVGLPYRCEIETLDLDLQGGETSDQLQSASEITVKMHESRGVQYRVTTSQDDYQELAQRTDEPYGDPVRLQTYDAILPVQSPWARSMRISLRQDDPLPMTILSITPEFDLQDRR